MTQQQRISEIRGLSAQLMDYGWFVAPHIVGEEHDRIKQLAAYIVANTPARSLHNENNFGLSADELIFIVLPEIAQASAGRAP